MELTAQPPPQLVCMNNLVKFESMEAQRTAKPATLAPSQWDRPAESTTHRMIRSLARRARLTRCSATARWARPACRGSRCAMTPI